MHQRNEITEGEWAGWSTWPEDAWEMKGGPFYCRTEENGLVRSRFHVTERHLNGAGAVHGGCLLTFADFAVFAIADHAIEGRAVTVNLSGDFLAPAFPGDVLDATGEVTRAGGRLLYVRGMITSQKDESILSFTSVITRLRSRS